MSDDAILRQSRTQADRESFTRDGNGQVARRVTDSVTHDKLDEVIGALDGSVGVITNIYDSVSSIASSTLTTVVSYTVPVGKSFNIKTVEGCGTNISRFDLEIDSTVVARKRTYFSGPFFVNFDFYNLSLSETQIIRLRIFHTSPLVGDFEGRIVGDLI